MGSTCSKLREMFLVLRAFELKIAFKKASDIIEVAQYCNISQFFMATSRVINILVRPFDDKSGEGRPINSHKYYSFFLAQSS